MSPYWSQERLFGHWGPTNRLVFRILIIAVIIAFTLVGYYVWKQSIYNDKLNTYVHDARDARIKSQDAQQKQIQAAHSAADLARAASRDVACFTVNYAKRANPKASKDPFIKSLSKRYDCAHYKIPPNFPGALPSIAPSRSRSSSSAPPPGSSSTQALGPPETPGASPSPSVSPRPRQSSTAVSLPGPTRTRTTTTTTTATATVTTTPPPGLPGLVCGLAEALIGKCPIKVDSLSAV